MLANKISISALHCTSCSAHVFRTFTSKAIGSTIIPRPPGLKFHNHPKLKEPEDIKITDSESAGHGSETSSAQYPIPWYLQQQINPQQPSTLPLPEQQQYPILPADAPSILKPLLSHIFIELGLERLSLLDLRNLDPPPALGANLIMILCTARSEKHLHSSADKLCRWLRSNHKLSPYADGLLGRDETKRKLKRMARKTKLLGSVGYANEEKPDDGIRTNWVCVNLGNVLEAASPRNSDTGLDSGSSGFAARTESCRIVVQMLTCKKRSELDLERLWGGILQRATGHETMPKIEAQESGIPEGTKDTTLPSELQLLDSSGDMDNSPVQPSIPEGTKDTTVPSELQLLDLSGGMEKSPIQPSIYLDSTQTNYSKTSTLPTDILTRQDITNVKGVSKHISKSLVLPSHSRQFQTLEDKIIPNASKNNYTKLNRYLKHLRKISRHKALRCLGKNARDTHSTSFLRKFYAAFPITFEASHWDILIEFISYGIQIGHKGYTKEALMDAFHAMELSEINIDSHIPNNMLNGLLIFNPSTRFPFSGLSVPKGLEQAASVFESMQQRGYDLFKPSTLTRILEYVYSIIPKEISHPTSQNLDLKPREPSAIIYDRLRHIMSAFDIGLLDTAAILESRAQHRDWPRFWEIWRSIPHTLQSRHAGLYYLLFRIIASTNSQSACISALRHNVLEMKLEEPEIKLNADLARAIIDVIKVADPAIESDFKLAGRASVRNEWAPLWIECHNAIRPHQKLSRYTL
ncbi:MAG: ATPase synthesis protein 25 mitochondrial [Trizodia sp. TS-e1964]|nr:MAG: ATPase synthesis protein 25 mitochondrial [Trizodia sp. TS-e1964]